MNQIWLELESDTSFSHLSWRIYPKGVEETSKAGNGLKFGVIMGLLFSLPISIIFYSVYEGVTIPLIIAEAIWHSFEQGLGGLAIAYSYGLPAVEARKTARTA